MKSDARQDLPRFAPYFKSNSVLIQFIMDAFLQSSLIVHEIMTLFDEDKQSKAIDQILVRLQKLVGSGQGQQQKWTCGPLEKLKEHSRQLVKNGANKVKKYHTLYIHSQRTWLAALCTLESLSSIPLYSFQESLFKATLKSFDLFRNHFLKFARTVQRVCIDFIEDENVLLYFLRNRALLEEVCGCDLVGKWMQKRSNKGLFFVWLADSYKKRGFEAIASQIALAGHQYRCENRFLNHEID